MGFSVVYICSACAAHIMQTRIPQRKPKRQAVRIRHAENAHPKPLMGLLCLSQQAKTHVYVHNEEGNN